MDGWMDLKKIWMAGRMDKKIMKYIWMVGWIKKIKNGWMDGQGNKIYEKNMDGWMDG